MLMWQSWCRRRLTGRWRAVRSPRGGGESAELLWLIAAVAIAWLGSAYL